MARKKIEHTTHPAPDATAQEPDPRPGWYFVTAKDGPRTAWLVGPFPMHTDALQAVPLTRQIAERVDPRAAFYAFGTARHENITDTRQGVINGLYLAALPVGEVTTLPPPPVPEDDIPF